MRTSDGTKQPGECFYPLVSFFQSMGQAKLCPYEYAYTYRMASHAGSLLYSIATAGRHSLAPHLAGVVSQPMLRALLSLAAFELSSVRATRLRELLHVFAGARHP